VTADAEFFHLGLGHFDARFVLVGVENGLHPQPTLRFRGPDQIDNRLIVDQRLAFPGRLMKENNRCSILFHLLVPGG